MTQSVCAGCAMEGRGPVRDRTEQWLAAEVAGRLVLVCATEWSTARAGYLCAERGEVTKPLVTYQEASDRLGAAVAEYLLARAALDAPPPKLHGDRCPTCGMPR